MNAPASDLATRLEPAGRILELEDWFVWGASAIDGPDGKVHLFAARWPAELKMAGWSTHSEIVHAVGDTAEGPFEVRDVALTSREDRWDAGMVHNPTIHEFDGRYYLVHIGNRDGRPFTQAIGIAAADSLDGPWHRPDGPVLGPPQRTDWDWLMATNPAMIRHPNGEYRLYYKSWDFTDKKRKVGLATADDIFGPYRRHPDNPLVDYSDEGKQFEDPYVYLEDGVFYMILADDNEGVVKKHGGMLIRSRDGIDWSEPELAYDTTAAYFGGAVERFERPQVLMREGRPAYLYIAATGGAHGTASPVCMRVRQ